MTGPQTVMTVLFMTQTFFAFQIVVVLCTMLKLCLFETLLHMKSSFQRYGMFFLSLGYHLAMLSILLRLIRFALKYEFYNTVSY